MPEFSGDKTKTNVTMASDRRHHSSRDKFRRGDYRKTSLVEFGTTSFGTEGYYDNTPGRKRRKKWSRTSTKTSYLDQES